MAFDIIMKAKDNQMNNGDLYDAYVKSCKYKNEEAEKYSAFNIKCRSLFNTQKLLRKKAVNGASSREDIISLNGRVKPSIKQDLNDIDTSKKASEKPKEIPLSVDAKKKSTTNKKQDHGKR
jgi:hypothetical protein